MKRKTLYALALLLFLSTIAFSNERARFRCGTSGPTATSGATTAESHALLHTFIKLLYI
ncbi:MAG TPA: hypothetical protein VKR41_03445 [Puia sp.]|nr:hypothetical protein [Puia sp.]